MFDLPQLKEELLILKTKSENPKIWNDKNAKEIFKKISLLEKKQDPDTQSKVINTMKRQVGHMTKMINDLLDVSRITRGKIKLEKENLAIQKVIKNAVETCTTIIEENKHNLSLNLPEDFLWINGDATRLSQIFSNILNNASKYTDPGGKIEILVTKDKEWVSVKIKDNGLGIPENKLNQNV